MPLIKITHHPHENEMSSKIPENCPSHKYHLRGNFKWKEILNTNMAPLFNLLVQEFEFEAFGGLCSDNGDC